ncbi:MAG: DNA mismatch repair protein MutS [Clostridiales bacterium]|nr:DNA mismatch repair protein MutS [Clostridiales bacterium]
MMRHYLEVKERFPDALLFYRLGDFYELFFDDAITASKALEITLTGRDCGLDKRAEMCGVPFHSAEKYIARLIDKGYKVAICEQMEDPSKAVGLVERDVVRVVTPGTLIESSMLDETKNNYIMSVCLYNDVYGIAVSDISTGEFFVSEIPQSKIQSDTDLKNEISVISPREIIYNSNAIENELFSRVISSEQNIYSSKYHDWAYAYSNARTVLLRHFDVVDLSSFGLEGLKSAVCAAGALLEYLFETQKTNVKQLTSLRYKHTGKSMYIDGYTRRNLELTETMRTGSKRGSLLGLLDKTETSMGSRMLRGWIAEPLNNYFEIDDRLCGVEDMLGYVDSELAELLGSVYDFERIASRISSGTASPRDLLALKQSAKKLPEIKSLLSKAQSKLLKYCVQQIDTLDDVAALIENIIDEDAPLSIKEGGIIKSGYSIELDNFRSAMRDGKGWIAGIEQKERDRTGIKGLKIGFNKVFGYYIDVTRSYVHMVPEDYIRKQTLANSERYITPELKELENIVLGAEEKSYKLEHQIFSDLRSEIALEIIRIQKTAKQIATIDCLLSFARVSAEYNYTKPRINDKGIIEIKNGRHPVIERTAAYGQFTPNDVYMTKEDNRVIIITGPNMAGKSTYMRQIAIITLMAHMGCFVPCDYADICITDRVFTRVGASDDLSQGQSTFMVEMIEVANILNNATDRSLLIFDEIGRGTSTFDGLSIAWAVVEYVSDKRKIGAKTLFATHYHELTEIEDKIEGVVNYHVLTKEINDDIIFMRKIVKGQASRSYGIQVAKLAGLPETVIRRSKEILSALEAKDQERGNKGVFESKIVPVLDDDKSQKAALLHQELLEMDLMKITPLEALVILEDMQRRYK